MSKLSNALQGKLNHSQNRHIKDPSERQLDLFSSLSDRSLSLPKFVRSTPGSEPQDEPEMILPRPGHPPDVSADVRAVLSESGQVRHVDAAPPSGEAPVPLRTGVYHRVRRPAAPPVFPPSKPAAPSSGARTSLFRRIGDWLAGVEMDRRMISLVGVLTVLVALIAFWTARPGQDGEVPGADASLDEIPPATEAAPAAPPPGSAATASAAPAAPSVAPAGPGWETPGAVAVQNGGVVLIRFTAPVFVSADKISIEGMDALKAVAAKLVAMNAGARAIVTGYTDNEPLTKPTPQFKSNADIAAARAKVAMAHLAQFARANKGLAFEAQTGESSRAPYPNDTPQNRRLNRTVTVQVIPAP
ncbi:MAG: hypothetical protein EOM72_03580 [Opitutae bacterium]|nr:hypothetical protein [Opitutae bacterium]